MNDGNEIFDRQKMLDCLDGDIELIKRICSKFLSTYSPVLDNIRTAVSNKDCNALVNSAHYLKGSFAVFYAERAKNAAFELEMIGKNASFDNAGACLAILEKEVQALVTCLEKELQENSGTAPPAKN